MEARGLREREPLRGEQRRGHRGVDVHDGERRARLEHGIEGGLPPTASTVAYRGRDPDHRGGDEARDDRRQRALSSGEDEVHLGTPGLDPVHDRQEPVESRHADVVRSNDPHAQFVEESGGFLGERHITRAGRDDGHHARAIPGAERPGKADQPAAREKADARPGAGRRAKSA